MSGPVDDTIVKKSVINLQKKYGSKVNFFIYNYREAEKYGSLAEELNIKVTPETTIINGNGEIIKSIEGFTDEKTIEQGLFDSLNS